MFPEIRDLRLDAPYLAALARLMALVAPHVSWPALSRIPRSRRTGSRLQQVRDLLDIELGNAHGFLATGTAHELSRKLGWIREGPRASRLFELLCANLAVDARELGFVLSEADLAALVEAGVLLRLGPAVMMTVSIVPYGERWYVGDAWHLKDNAEAYGMPGAPVGYDTWLQIEYLHRRLAERTVGRMLEVGPGLGIVLHELADVVEVREGAEFDARTLGFARANLALHQDHGARVFESDLLSGASGEYELIVFNPWQPSEAHFGLIERFLEQAAAHLAPQGAICLLLNTQRRGAEEPLRRPLSEVLARLGLVAERDVVHTFATTMADGSPALRAQHFSWITRGRSVVGENITDTRTAAWAVLEGRALWDRLKKKL